ncbi:MAG: hypothetical protein K2V71_09565 [Methylotenera sp.]|nr:hypothetical protein [Methylotenera sp.]
MNRFLNKIDVSDPSKLTLVIVILAMLIAAQIQYIQHGWINPDSVLYLESARLISLGHWSAAFEVFNWPLYSACIAAIHKISSLNIHHSAQLLSVIFFGITAFSFTKVIQLAGGNNRTIAAGGLILLSAQYLTGDILQMLLRDEGFWAFFLTSMVFFIRFYKTNRYLDAFYWQIFAILAVLFRIEAITYLIALPLSLFFYQQATFSQKVTQFLKCNFLSIIALISIFAAILMINSLTMTSFGRLNEVFTLNLWHQLTNQFFTKSAVMSSQVLGSYLDEFAVPGLLMTFAYVILAKSIATTGIVNIGLAALTVKFRKNLIDSTVLYILTFAAVITLINSGLIITKVFVLSGRYILALSLILMIVSAFYLAYLFQYFEIKQKKATRKKWLVSGLIVLMLLGIVKNILPKQRGYNHMQEAVSWVKIHNTSNKPVFYDDTRARYYANAPFIGTWQDNWMLVTDAIQTKQINQYDYLIINHSAKHPERESYLAKQLIAFKIVNRYATAKNKKSVVIYQKKHSPYSN